MTSAPANPDFPPLPSLPILHTPGPWGWRRGEGPGVWNLAPGVLVCTSGGPAGDRIDQANARLIERAPELRLLLSQLHETIAGAEVVSEFAGLAELLARADQLLRDVDGCGMRSKAGG